MKLLRWFWEWVRMMHRGCDHEYQGHHCDRCAREKSGGK